MQDWLSTAEAGAKAGYSRSQMWRASVEKKKIKFKYVKGDLLLYWPSVLAYKKSDPRPGLKKKKSA